MAPPILMILPGQAAPDGLVVGSANDASMASKHAGLLGENVPGDKTSALDAEDLKRAQRLGYRLATVLAQVIAALPAKNRSIRGMAGHLNVDTYVCQRALAASQCGAEPLEALKRTPGVPGLRSIAAAMTGLRMDRSLISALETAIEQFAAFIRETAGSHSKLQRRVDASRRADSSEAALADEQNERLLRRRAFQSVAACFGARMDATVSVAAIRTCPDAPDHIEGSLLSAYIGHRARAAAPPMVMGNLVHSDRTHDTGATAAESSPSLSPNTGVILSEFSTSPLPIISTANDESRSVQIFDPAASRAGPVDVVVLNGAYRSLHPRLCTRPLLTMITQTTYPSEHLIFDVWLEKKLATMSTASSHTCLVDDRLRRGEGASWYHRLPGTPKLELLSPGAARAVRVWPQQTAATERMFDTLGWSIAEFVGYRLHIEYPLWTVAAVMMFDFPTP